LPWNQSSKRELWRGWQRKRSKSAYAGLSPCPGKSFPGCGLLLSALLALKESGVEMPSAISLITPALDFAGKGESFLTKAKFDPFRLKDPLGVAKVYVGTNNPLSLAFLVLR
jgi:hypothetical protein